ncbi:MAG TPA: SCO family protein, partial [Acidothermaceae bacterium]
TADAVTESPAATTVTGPAEHPARTLLRISFGLLWIFDGLLQIQQAMPVGLPTQVVQPAAATSPGWVKHLVNDGTLIWTRHPISAAAATVWIQIGVGVLLLLDRCGRLSQWAGLVGVAWGLVVWVFGEAFGGIFGSGQSWLFGAPGAVLFYVAAGALVALPERVWNDKRLGRALLGVLGIFFIGMAILQAWPGRGFWQGQRDPHATAGSLTSMVQTMSQTSQPRALSSLVSSFASFDAQHGWFVNLFVVLALAGLGIALLISRERVTFGALVFGSIFCIAVWVFVQDLGFLGGVGTDPNSMMPTVLLIAAGYLALTRRVEPALADETVPAEPAAGAAGGETPAGSMRRLRPLSSPATLGLISVVATFGVVLVGAVPMAFASVNTHTDTIVTEAINGQPQTTDTRAAPFELTDQHGTPVNLATFKGRTVALTFLDPVCTTDCPLIAQEFRQVDQRLGTSPNTAFVAVVANPTYLDVQFVQAFDAQENMDMPNWYFLTGSLAQLRAVWDSYGIQVQTTGSGGMSAHSDTTYVIDGNGHLRTILGADPGDTSTDSASFATLLNKEMRAVAGA